MQSILNLEIKLTIGEVSEANDIINADNAEVNGGFLSGSLVWLL